MWWMCNALPKFVRAGPCAGPRKTAGRGFRAPTHDSASNRGVTLVELLAVIGVFSLLAAMLVFLFGSMDQSYRSVDTSLDVYQNARAVLARMNRELSSTLIDNNAIAPLGLKGSAGDISFHTFIDPRSWTATDTSSEVVAIRYAPSSTDSNVLMRYLANSDANSFPAIPLGEDNGEELARGITALSFEYFASASDFYSGVAVANWDSSAAGSAALPALIRIRVSVVDSKKLRVPQTFETAIHLRSNSP